MSTAILNNLLEYLYGTLTPNNMRWVAEHLVAQAEKMEDEPIKPYTMEEINAMIDRAEEDFANGLGIPDDKVWEEMEKQFGFEIAVPE